MGLIWGASEGAPQPGNLILVFYFSLVSFFARFLLDRFVYKVFFGLICFNFLLKHPSYMEDNQKMITRLKSVLLSSVMLFYMCQCGFYLYSIVALVAWETRRKDLSIMMSHHIVTSILIGFSYITRAQSIYPPPLSWMVFSFRIGTIILALHDASDVFLEAAELFKYSEKELTANLCFGLFAISWLLLRLVYFPFWIIKSSSYDRIEALSWMDNFPTMLYYIFNMMLLTLLVLHIYWWNLIFAMILKQLRNRGKVGEDIRSDSENED